MKKHLVIFFSALAVLFFSACNNWNPMPIPVTDIVFEPPLPAQQLSLSVGGTYQLNAKVKPDNATNKTLIYTSNNVKIAPVNDKGVIEAKQAGQAVVTIKAADNISKEITVVVTDNTPNKTEVPGPAAPIAVKSIVLSPDEDTVSLVNGTSRQLKAQVQPENATNKKLTFASSAPAIASINENGTITAHKLGNADITIQAANEVSKKLKVIVTAEPVAVKDIAFDPALPGDPLLLSVGSPYQLHAKAQPEDATNKKLTYSSADDSIASVDDKGMVTARKTGDTKITIKASNGVSKEITVTVTTTHISVTGIALRSGETAISVENRGTHQIGAYVMPENATNKNLTYSSDDEMIASVNDEGVITTHNEGIVNITITAVDNPALSKQVTLTVTKAIVRVTSIEFNPPLPTEPIEMFLNEMYKFDAKAMPEEAENRKLKFDTSDFKVAWVEDIHKGWIKADGEGEATVTIIADDNPFVKREVRFKMIRKPAGPSISVETPSVQCESNEGDVSFTVKTINGKLAYTPEVVGGGKEWVPFVRKDNTDASTDTIRLHLKKNKTVWYRNAYIKFKDNTTNKYVKAAGKELQVKIIQKRNEHPVVTTKWVHGITPPTEGEKHKVEIPNTYPQAYHEMPYVFTWNETAGTTFFNTRKITHTFVLSGGYHGPRPDGNQCWAKTDANMLHWWFVQNKDNIEQYKIKKTAKAASEGKIFDSTLYEPVYTRGLADDEEDQKSSIANLFREKCQNSGGSPAKGLQWYLFGLDNFELLRNKGYSPALFKDVFNQSNTPIELVTIRTKKEFEDTLKAALNAKKAVGLNRYGTDGTQHAITLWGAAFDEDDNIIAIYVVDNNDVPNRVFTYGIQYQDGVDIYAEPDYEHNDRLRYNPYFFNYSNNSLSKNHCIGEIITLDKGEDQWAEWKRNNP